MSLGKAPKHEDLFRSSRAVCEERLPETSVYRLLASESHRLFPDEAFADLFADVGRNSIPPRIVATVMVLQRIEGLSDREAVDRFAFDLRWKYAAGSLDFEYAGFVHTVLVDMRARLRRSSSPDRIFEAVLEVAKQAGMVGRKRVLDSTALYDAVATQDTVTMLRNSIRGLLRVAGALENELRAALKRDDDYTSAGKPACDWDDKTAREALVDALARDAYALLAVLDGKELSHEVKQAAALVATVVGQDLEEREDGLFRIARRVAPDRVISTVDPETRHGHKTAARGFDGYKGHISIDPDSEIITAATVTAGNVADGSVATKLLEDVLGEAGVADAVSEPSGPVSWAPEVNSSEQSVDASNAAAAEPVAQEPVAADAEATMPPSEEHPALSTEGTAAPVPDAATNASAEASGQEAKVEIYGDASYGTAEVLAKLEEVGAEANVKVQLPSAPEGMFSKEDFDIDVGAGTVRCPAAIVAKIRGSENGGGVARFGASCASCPLRPRCTSSEKGRTINVHPSEELLARHRQRQKAPEWKKKYRATRPKIERKLGHLMRHRHGGRRSRMRGRQRTDQDFKLLCAGTNLKRLAVLMYRPRLPDEPNSSRAGRD